MVGAVDDCPGYGFGSQGCEEGGRGKGYGMALVGADEEVSWVVLVWW